MKFQKTKIGGLSGATWDEKQKKLWVVSDDRGNVNEPRIYSFSLTWKKNKFSVAPQEVIFLKNSKSKSKKIIYDLEGLALRNQKFILSSEGDNNQKPRSLPRIFEFDPITKVEAGWEIPEQFLPELVGKQTKGIRNNSGFEGLSISPSGKKVLAGLERSLVQNSTQKDDQVQFLLFENENGKNQLKKILNYQLDLENHDQGVILDRGLSEVLFLDEDRVLVLERAAALTANRITFPSRIFQVTLSDMKKKLILNFADLDPEFSLENFEAMAKFDHYLVVISDDNFKKSQKSEFILFDIQEELQH